MGGSVLPGTLILVIGGAGASNATPAVLSRTRWFFGHEAAHFWLGQVIHYDSPASAWITEGGADLMAVRALDHLTPGYDSRAELQHSLTECLTLAGSDKPLSGASARGEVRANYTCGAMLLLAAEAANKKQNAKADVFTWLGGLIDANRADGVVGEKDWLDRFAKVADPQTVREVRAFIDKGAPSPPDFFARLFTATGVAFTRKDNNLFLG
jgi:hypothetical protein